MKEKLVKKIQNVKDYVRENKTMVSRLSAIFIILVLIGLSFSIGKLIKCKEEEMINVKDVHVAAKSPTEEIDEELEKKAEIVKEIEIEEESEMEEEENEEETKEEDVEEVEETEEEVEEDQEEIEEIKIEPVVVKKAPIVHKEDPQNLKPLEIQ